MKKETAAVQAPATEREGSFFEPVLPDQFFSARRDENKSDAERRLMAKVLLDSLECFIRNKDCSSRRKKRLFQEEEEWIFSTSNRWIFSFENICQELDLDPADLRKKLIKYKENTPERVMTLMKKRSPRRERSKKRLLPGQEPKDELDFMDSDEENTSDNDNNEDYDW